MMAPPRSQCLNASRYLVKKLSRSRATFSTSQLRRAEDEPRRHSAADLLAALDGSSASETTPRTRDPFGSITLPRKTPRTLPRAPPRAATTNATSSIQRLIANTEQRKAAFAATRQPGQLSQSSADEMEKDKRGHELSRQITRRWRPGDVYSPHDLSEVEMAKWKKRSRPIYDAFDVLDFKPADSYKNFSIMSEFMTPMGRIKHSRETGLRPVNQRRIARAIRRSIGMGLMPSVHEHPEILQKRLIKRNEQLSPIRRGPI